VRTRQPLWETLLEAAGAAFVVGVLVISAWRWIAG
jgi:hypothetical protein